MSVVAKLQGASARKNRFASVFGQFFRSCLIQTSVGQLDHAMQLQRTRMAGQFGLRRLCCDRSMLRYISLNKKNHRPPLLEQMLETFQHEHVNWALLKELFA